MIERQHGKIIIACDSCDETYEGERGDEWDDVWGPAKDEGWKARIPGGDWLHYCPSCEAPT